MQLFISFMCLSLVNFRESSDFRILVSRANDFSESCFLLWYIIYTSFERLQWINESFSNLQNVDFWLDFFVKMRKCAFGMIFLSNLFIGCQVKHFFEFFSSHENI